MSMSVLMPEGRDDVPLCCQHTGDGTTRSGRDMDFANLQKKRSGISRQKRRGTFIGGIAGGYWEEE
jgi:hypothetical protein